MATKKAASQKASKKGATRGGPDQARAVKSTKKAAPSKKAKVTRGGSK
jgi:hypothetical protein